jgi:hypothetical protein
VLGACDLFVIGVSEVYPAHLEGFVFSKVCLRRTGSLWAIMCIHIAAINESLSEISISSIFVTRIILSRRTIEVDLRQPKVERENAQDQPVAAVDLQCEKPPTATRLHLFVRLFWRPTPESTGAK